MMAAGKDHHSHKIGDVVRCVLSLGLENQRKIAIWTKTMRFRLDNTFCIESWSRVGWSVISVVIIVKC